jgi:hypothetical protein
MNQAGRRDPGRRFKPTLGDVFEIEIPRGLAYIQYVGRSKLYGGELVRLLPGIHRNRPEFFDQILSDGERFFTFIGLRDAVSDGFAKHVYHAELPDRLRVFPLMRWGTPPPRGGGPRKWRVFDGEHYGELQDLTPEMAKLSVTGVPNRTRILQMIESGYQPEDET